MKEVEIRTSKHTEFLRIDREVQQAVAESGVKNGFVQVFVPHTTAGVTINENADPDVTRDLAGILEQVVPWRGDYAHAEGNSAAHAKASMMGFCQTVFIRDGKLRFGTWQSIYFCEFDGPRARRIWVQVVGV
jgi:secondary thiamine-phosphate synthase enzyme